jgi:hypothetical protein
MSPAALRILNLSTPVKLSARKEAILSYLLHLTACLPSGVLNRVIVINELFVPEWQ